MGSVSRAGATKGLVSIGGCFDLRGLRGGRGRTGFVTTAGSRTIGFRSSSCRVFTMGFILIGILGFGLRSDLTRFTMYYPLQHRSRFWLGLFMCLHVRFKCASVSATLVALRAFKRLVRHLCSQKRTVNGILNKSVKSRHVKAIRLHD